MCENVKSLCLVVVNLFYIAIYICNVHTFILESVEISILYTFESAFLNVSRF